MGPKSLFNEVAMETLKKIGKFVAVGVLWIFVLSVRVEDERLFDKAHGVLIENPVVRTLDQKLAEGVDALRNYAYHALSPNKG